MRNRAIIVSNKMGEKLRKSGVVVGLICEVCDSWGETRKAVWVARTVNQTRWYKALCAPCFESYNRTREQIGYGKQMTDKTWRRI